MWKTAVGENEQKVSSKSEAETACQVSRNGKEY